MRYWLVMPAAGVGRRFGTAKPKQYAPLQGRTVIESALALFRVDAACAGIAVALAAEDPYWDEIASRLAKVPGRKAELIFAEGGAERSHTFLLREMSGATKLTLGIIKFNRSLFLKNPYCPALNAPNKIAAAF